MVSVLPGMLRCHTAVTKWCRVSTLSLWAGKERSFLSVDLVGGNLGHIAFRRASDLFARGHLCTSFFKLIEITCNYHRNVKLNR